MATYETVTVQQMYLDEFGRLVKFIGNNYNPKTEEHLVSIHNIGSVGLTNVYNGKKGGVHQLFIDIELKVKDDISQEKRAELEDIIKQC